MHLKAYGFIKVFRIVSNDGDIGYWATDELVREGKIKITVREHGDLISLR